VKDYHEVFRESFKFGDSIPRFNGNLGIQFPVLMVIWGFYA